MKKKCIIVILLLLGLSVIYANAGAYYHTPRGYSQNVISPKTDILKIVNNTGATHNSTYLLEATCSSSPGQVLTTAQPGGENPNNLRIFSIRKGNLQKVFCYVQLAEFENPVEPGDEIHCKVTYIGKGKYQNQSTSWSYFVPEGTASIIVMDPGEEQIIPPLDKKTLLKQKQ
jgi:hypothetical protein